MLNLLGKFLGQRDDQEEKSPNKQRVNDVIESPPDLDDSEANKEVAIDGSSEVVKEIEPPVISEERMLSDHENEQNSSVIQGR